LPIFHKGLRDGLRYDETVILKSRLCLVGLAETDSSAELDQQLLIESIGRIGVNHGDRMDQSVISGDREANRLSLADTDNGVTKAFIPFSRKKLIEVSEAFGRSASFFEKNLFSHVVWFSWKSMGSANFVEKAT
jgi:hypothetical protein